MQKSKTIVLWLKLTPTYLYKKDNDVWRKKYSSVTSEKTEETTARVACKANMNVAETLRVNKLLTLSITNCHCHV